MIYILQDGQNGIYICLNKGMVCDVLGCLISYNTVCFPVAINYMTKFHIDKLVVYDLGDPFNISDKDKRRLSGRQLNLYCYSVCISLFCCKKCLIKTKLKKK